MKRVALLVLTLLSAASFCSCGGATVSFDPGRPLSFQVYSSIPKDTEVIVINMNSQKIHTSACRYASTMKEENRLITEASAVEYYLSVGYTTCKICFQQNNYTTGE